MPVSSNIVLSRKTLDFTRELYQTYKKKLYLSFSNYSKTLKRRGHSQIHSMRPTLPRYQNKTKTLQKRNYEPKSLIILMQKSSKKKKPNQIQQCRKRIIQQDQAGFIPGSQVWFNISRSFNAYTTLRKGKTKTTIISIDAEKAFDKIQHPFMIKLSSEWV